MMIFAPATPPGRSALQIIRLSGPAVPACLEVLAGRLPPPRHLTRAHLFGPEGEPLDDAMIVYFPAEASPTGEPAAELHLHGSPAVASAVCSVLAGFEGSRLAEPGEFSRRAFHHNKMGLDQLEALADLIDAETAVQRRQALQQLGGRLAAKTEDWRHQLVTLAARLEALIDFADEDLPAGLEAEIASELARLGAEFSTMLEASRGGEIRRSGASLVLVGLPNSGKSTLLNTLLDRDAAIVSPLPGTTRDRIEASLDLGGYAVRLTDTAGLRQAEDSIEAEGIRRSTAAAATADLVLLLLESTADHAAITASQTIYQDIKQQNPHARWLLLATKSDCATSQGLPSLQGLPPVLPVSAMTGAGMVSLEQALLEALEALAPPAEDIVLTRTRHRQAMTSAAEALARATEVSAISAPELMAEEIRLAATALGRISGRIDVEDILDHLFSSFCIGK